MHSSELRKKLLALPLKCLTDPFLLSSNTKSVKIQPTHFRPNNFVTLRILASFGSGKCNSTLDSLVVLNVDKKRQRWMTSYNWESLRDLLIILLEVVRKWPKQRHVNPEEHSRMVRSDRRGSQHVDGPIYANSWGNAQRFVHSQTLYCQRVYRALIG